VSQTPRKARGNTHNPSSGSAYFARSSLAGYDRIDSVDVSAIRANWIAADQSAPGNTLSVPSATIISTSCAWVGRVSTCDVERGSTTGPRACLPDSNVFTIALTLDLRQLGPRTGRVGALNYCVPAIAIVAVCIQCIIVVERERSAAPATTTRPGIAYRRNAIASDARWYHVVAATGCSQCHIPAVPTAFNLGSEGSAGDRNCGRPGTVRAHDNRVVAILIKAPFIKGLPSFAWEPFFLTPSPRA